MADLEVRPCLETFELTTPAHLSRISSTVECDRFIVVPSATIADFSGLHVGFGFPVGSEDELDGRMRLAVITTTMLANVVLAAAAVVVAPAARADMPIGNYELQTARDPSHSWVWIVNRCLGIPECVHVSGVPRPNGGAAPYDGDASMVNGVHVLTIDVPGGYSCLGYTIDMHDTYSWDPITLTGHVDSTFPAGCGSQPPGTYTFTLVRM